MIAKNMLFGILPAMIFTIIAILLFALLIKVAGIADTAIPPVNQVIKVLGIMITACLFCRRPGELKWLFGGIAGAVYIVLGYLVFSLMQGAFTFSLVLLSDVGMGFIIGVLTSLILSKFFFRK